MSLESKISVLQDRAYMLAKARQFFAEKNIMEVDCPALTKGSPIDQHIDVMSLSFPGGEKRHLYTSPEYGMKRLLADGIGDIYQICHVFRSGESGHLHNPEFTMVEWYQNGIPFSQIIEETLSFIKLFLGDLPHQIFSYRDLLKKYFELDYLHATCAELLAACEKYDLPKASDMKSWDKDTLLQYMVSFYIEPKLGVNEFTVINYFPASQAALSKTLTIGEEPVAERFEIYYQGIELCNGFHELTDAKEQEKRFVRQNELRKSIGKDELPIDTFFLEALEKGLPDCCGVAVGFDRLMLLKHKKATIQEVIPFSWEIA
ncbi:MAG: EF-P lysine aminoacylase GenX [Chlamydiae bacterium]|nr:EF-P lysine aminoacylase GenX [Chlamydiota bacterium]